MLYKEKAADLAEQVINLYVYRPTLFCTTNSCSIDPVRIAKWLGISVFASKLPPNIAGAIVKDLGRDPKILLDSDDTLHRQRFICAYELGHFVDSSCNRDEAEVFEFIDLRTQIFAGESFAACFALNLLMPENKFKQEFKKSLVLAELVYKFGVPLEAVCQRREMFFGKV